MTGAVPFAVRVCFLFGGRLGAAAWAALALMTVAAGPFLVRSSLFTPLVGDVEIAKGVSLGCRRTGSSEGGSEDHPGSPIYRIAYRFEVDGRAYGGVSFETWCPERGTEWSVHYARRDPERSVLAGMRRNVFGPAGAAVAMFPLAALIFVTVTLRLGRRRIRLLRDGPFRARESLPHVWAVAAAEEIARAPVRRSLVALAPPALVAGALALVLWTAPDRVAPRPADAAGAPPAGLEVERTDPAAR